ncbi:MAG: CopG family transcriptional regulator [Minisyncoccia bacterium]
MTQKKVYRVQVTFTSEQWEMIKKAEGLFGNTDAEIIRNIVISWLAEKSILSSNIKKNDNVEK